MNDQLDQNVELADLEVPAEDAERVAGGGAPTNESEPTNEAAPTNEWSKV